jgi:UDP:flavonoid glycosyltransferase YjiC (YdhE family)
MSRLLVLTWDGAGNQVPMAALGAELAARGHEITVAGYASQLGRFDRHGFDFRTLPRADAGYPAEPPPEGWIPALVDSVWACPAHLDDVEDLLRGGGYTAVIADCLMFGALARLETSAVPTAVLVHSAPGALTPPGEPMEGMLLPAVNAVRERAGLRPVIRLWDAWAPFTTICASITELDPLDGKVPEAYPYVGPLFEHTAPSGMRLPWGAADPRPLVVASFSTGPAWDQVSRIQRTLDAVAGLPYRAVVTTAHTDGAALRVPGNAVTRRWVPHAELLPGAAATVTHAGHGTVAASLAYGVPVVCLPNPAADQPALAARVAELGAGIALDGETATPGEIAAAVRTVTEDPAYRTAAAALAARIATAPGVAAAADLIERPRPW